MTSSAEGSPANPFRLPVEEQDRTTNDGYGPSSPDAFAHYDPDTSSWRTSQGSLFEEWATYSEIWPRAGTTQNGIASRRLPLVPLTSVTESSLWRTPQAAVTEPKSSVLKLEGRTPDDPQVGLADQVMAAERGLWPTPTARDHKDTGDLSNVPENGLLPRVVQRVERETWPTPTQADGTGGPGSSGRDGGDNLRTAAGGQLNPTFVEWLMGFPEGWSDSER